MNKVQSSQKINPEYVLNLKKPTDSFLCSLQANIYNIQFLAFKIRDAETNQVFFSIEKEGDDEEMKAEAMDDIYEEELRTVRYHFGPNFFKLKEIGTSLVFSVGEKPLKNFRMIERHYFKDKLIQSFDFTFPFCMPKTTNTWESIYEIPSLDSKTIDDMIKSPWLTKSDSFYFVGNDLVMHNKAEYSYSEHLDEEEGE